MIPKFSILGVKKKNLRILYKNESNEILEELYYLILYEIRISLSMDGNSKKIYSKTFSGTSDECFHDSDIIYCVFMIYGVYSSLSIC